MSLFKFSKVEDGTLFSQVSRQVKVPFDTTRRHLTRPH